MTDTDKVSTTDKVVATDNPVAKIWGEYEPGRVFWEDVVAPENQALKDGDERAQKLSERDLKSIQTKRSRTLAALAVWDYETYPKRLKYYRYLIDKAETPQQRYEREAKYRELKKNPPPPPPKPRFQIWRRQPPMVITSERQAQKLRLWVDRIEKRLAEHETAVRNQAIYDDLAREMQLEVSYFAQRIIHRWTALQNREEVYVKGKPKWIRVGIEKAVYTEDEIQYKIYVSSQTLLGASRPMLPDGVTAWNLVKPETLSELTAACERPVGSPHVENTPETFQNGAWVVVYREGLTDGLFDYVDYSRVITKYNPDNRDRFPVPIGVMRGRVLQWLYLDEHPHLMVNGISGSGKTNVIRCALTTWVQYHSPDEIRFYLVDLKRGGDFRKFANAPHLAHPTMTTTQELAVVIPQIVALMYQRMDTFSQTATRDIMDYNARTDEKMERLVFVIDECSAIDSLSDKFTREIIWNGLTLISTQARAAGIHLLLGTQQSFSDAIPKSVRDNITFVLSGRQRTLAASMATFGTGRAKKLPKIRGRMWCDDGGDLFQVQTPYVMPSDEDQAIAVSLQYGDYGLLALPDITPNAEGETEEETMLPARPGANFNMYDAARIAVEQFGGVLSRDKIFKVAPRGVASRDVVELIRQIAAHETIEVSDQLYRVLAHGRGWRLEAIDNEQTETGEFYELAPTGD